LQNSLSETEDAIQNSRRYYNAVVRDLKHKDSNPSQPTFSLACSASSRKQFFETAAADREPVASEILEMQRRRSTITDFPVLPLCPLWFKALLVLLLGIVVGGIVPATAQVRNWRVEDFKDRHRHPRRR